MMWSVPPGTRFVAGFLVLIACFSALLQIGAIDRALVTPLTEVIAHVSSAALNAMGAPNDVRGTVIVGDEGFAVNILDGCNGVYVTAIVIAAVLAFPSTAREKLIGLLMGILGVHAINLVRILTLYWIGLHWPHWFERFHYYVWQTGVIIISMAIWILWAEVVVRPASPTRRRGSPAPSG